MIVRRMNVRSSPRCRPPRKERKHVRGLALVVLYGDRDVLADCCPSRVGRSDRVVARRRAGCVLDNRTVFKGINVLPAGSLYNFRAGLLEEKRNVLPVP